MLPLYLKGCHFLFEEANKSLTVATSCKDRIHFAASSELCAPNCKWNIKHRLYTIHNHENKILSYSKVDTPWADHYGWKYCTRWKWKTPASGKNECNNCININKFSSISLVYLRRFRSLLFYDGSPFHYLWLECRSLWLHFLMAPKRGDALYRLERVKRKLVSRILEV